MSSFAKSASDVVVAAVLLVHFLPLMLVVAVAIKLESAGPILYRSRRVGLRGEEFEMLKFRKMHRDAAGPPLTSRHDERLTGVGSFLLRTKFDELPQLWNVVRGHMSLVGPRPEAPIFVGFYPDEYQMVLRVKPGITGLSQLAFAKENDILERPELAGRYTDRLLPAKIAIDSLYIARRSLSYDARILALDLRRNRPAARRRRRSRRWRALGATPPGDPSHSLRGGNVKRDPGPYVSDLRSTREAHTEDMRRTKVVILAGGKGARLKPYTSVLPKPLMPLGDRAILEVVIRQLAHQGFVDITLSVGHLAHVIEAVFRDGHEHSVQLTYVREDAPLGTAGSLRLVPNLDDTFLMLNGDLVTTFDFRELVRAHRGGGQLLTIATTNRRVNMDYGILTVEPWNGRQSRSRPLHREADNRRHGEHGDLCARARGTQLHSADRVFRFPGSRAESAPSTRAGRSVRV